jgi:hypothetical protein
MRHLVIAPVCIFKNNHSDVFFFFFMQQVLPNIWLVVLRHYLGVYKAYACPFVLEGWALLSKNLVSLIGGIV